MMSRQEEVAARAFEIFCGRGGHHGRAQEDWLQAEREVARVTVLLSAAGDNKISVVKEVRLITGLDLAKARELVETTPQTLKSDATRREAESIRRRLTAVGAKVEVR